MNKLKDFNAKDAEAQRTQRREMLFVGWTLVQRHALSIPLYLKYKITFLSNIFFLCALCASALKRPC